MIAMNDVIAPKKETSTRDRLREIIRDAVAKANPIDDARRPVELIVETSVRLADRDGGTVQVVDGQGHVRGGVTIADVLEELREKPPPLFKASSDATTATAGDASPGITVVDAPPAPESKPPEPPQRDWLIIGEAVPGARAAGADADPALDVIERKEPRESLTRLTQDLGSRLGAAAETISSRLQDARGSVSHSFEDVQTEIFRDRSPRLSRGHVMGALAGVLALALVGALV